VWLEQKNGRENGCALGRRCKEDISHPTSSGPIARLHASVGSSQRAATADLQQARNFTRLRYFPSTGEVIRRTQDLLDWVIHYYAWSRAVHPSLGSRIPAHAIERVGDHQQAAPQTRFRPGQLARHNRGEVPAYRIAPSSCPPRKGNHEPDALGMSLRRHVSSLSIAGITVNSQMASIAFFNA
jgi:hypothetical protein